MSVARQVKTKTTDHGRKRKGGIKMLLEILIHVGKRTAPMLIMNAIQSYQYEQRYERQLQDRAEQEYAKEWLKHEREELSRKAEIAIAQMDFMHLYKEGEDFISQHYGVHPVLQKCDFRNGEFCYHLKKQEEGHLLRNC